MSAVRDRLRQEEGVSLVEIMVSIMILTVGLLALASVAGHSLRDLSRSERRQLASAATTEAIEQARSLASSAYDSVGMDGGTCNGASTWDAGGELVTAEPVVEGVISSTPPYVDTIEGLVDITTCVTWYDDPVTTDETQDAKRITVIATWNGETIMTRSGMVSG